MKHNTAAAVSTKPVVSLRDDIRSGRSYLVPRSVAERVRKVAEESGLTPGAVVRLFLEYGLRDHDAALVKFEFPPGQLVRK